MSKNKKLSRTLLKNLALSASAALGLALAPGCTLEGTSVDDVEFTLPSGESVSAVPWARFKREHPTEATNERGASLEVNGGALHYYPSLGKFAFLTAEERLAAAEMFAVSDVPYGWCSQCSSMCCDSFGSDMMWCSGWHCECEPDASCGGRPFTIDGVARTANVGFGDGWASV